MLLLIAVADVITKSFGFTMLMLVKLNVSITSVDHVAYPSTEYSTLPETPTAIAASSFKTFTLFSSGVPEMVIENQVAAALCV